ncbi:MAG: transcription antitermination factor NusB [Pseudomonadales bacterium]|jgi:N utilization substance protein B|nr:transcription antitermination factor NusB [Pseudomonadales bacterium]MDP6469589.1 transcription antitermination factor NusB [Pseudomonadales bacterium]MDP6827430.1 transcription antitermination factor NusB [Pseudomonadales bacterium]MDP6971253.1 transcription antitermination factor NusB [Pseudomonadales bacterium]|tara:strand:- start:355 stop:795 length:441 start_codon:yes stop_codon:yes gene_type:complete
MSGKVNPYARRQARRAALQAIYQWQMTQADRPQLIREFEESGSLDKADREFFCEALSKVLHDTAALDSAFVGYLDRELKSLDQVELAVLRLGAHELLNRIDVPFRVVIDEYVELAKRFGAEESHKYINGVLDKVAADTRTAEVLAR